MSAAWDESEAMLLLELSHHGMVARRRKTQARIWQDVVELGWARPTLAPETLVLVAAMGAEVAAALDANLPDWRQRLEILAAASLPVSPGHWRTARKRKRRDGVAEKEFPDQLSRRTATAQVSDHSKASFTDEDAAAFGDTQVTDDDIVRIRPDASLTLRRGGEAWSGRALARVMGEVVVTDRALRSGTLLRGHPRMVLTVENLGPFQDLPVPDDVMVVHLPGWNTRLVRRVLASFRGPLWHFGDLDRNGVRILNHLRQWRPDTRWVVPTFWQDHLDRALPGDWDDLPLPPDAPGWVRELRDSGRWLEQEVVALHPGWSGFWKAAMEGPARPSRL